MAETSLFSSTPTMPFGLLFFTSLAFSDFFPLQLSGQLVGLSLSLSSNITERPSERI